MNHVGGSGPSAIDRAEQDGTSAGAASIVLYLLMALGSLLKWYGLDRWHKGQPSDGPFGPYA